jgi:hypothetical protein
MRQASCPERARVDDEILEAWIELALHSSQGFGEPDRVWVDTMQSLTWKL